MHRLVSSYCEDTGYRSCLSCDNPSWNAGRGWSGVNNPGLSSLSPAPDLQYPLVFKCDLGGFVALPLRLTLSTIPAFCNPAVRGFFEGFHSSLATAFFRVMHRAQALALVVQGNAQHSDGLRRYLFVHPCVRGKFPSVQLT